MIGFKQALVTGGAGFIGSHLVDALVNDGCRVVVLDNLASGHRRNLDHHGNRIEFIEGDIRDGKLLEEVIQGCEVVFHQAAVVSVALSVEDPPHACDVNDLGTVRVLDAARKNGVRRVVMASSSAVYGDDPQLPKIETMLPRPLSPYAVQKLSGEYYASVFQTLYGLETVCLRYFNVYGPRQDPSSPYSGVTSIFLDKATTGDPPVIYGDGGQTRDFVFVKDVVSANLLAASQKKAAGQVFNVGTGASIRILDLWNAIQEISGITVKPLFEPGRAGDIRESISDISRIRETLGFQPQMGLRLGLEETLSWYQTS